ncbi:LysM peptidoglycan-binding domain-containing protein [Sediminibacillus halophilus]|uniref:LysM domain-containing protein n=1 Tax=Sediminibacillus halophilus TaxID=482461 RepID=A0A1G9YIW0_9BACI|nr:LysM peptidoglycan-binding domain-containing protein [Sediminibacillus halophilus]SDN08431.1 hypothetical protein SAMN05216244_4170 [Sediminibacillus halophilus]
MGFLKKTVVTLFIVLFIVSIFKDLTVGTLNGVQQTEEQSDNLSESHKPSQKAPQQDQTAYQAIEVEVRPGDTVLSIIEEINRAEAVLAIDSIVTDFQKLNPGTDPQQIQPGETYLFPLYVSEE